MTVPDLYAPRPRLLDLFCGGGGAARGYQMAGFHVTGIDNRPQPRYAGDAFIQADALEYVAGHGHEYDVIHASPPCQAYSSMRHVTGKSYPDLVAPTRRALQATGKPFVIENVFGAPLLQPLMLCGTMFGLDVIRHRLFEICPEIYALTPPCCHNKSCAKQGRAVKPGQFITVTGSYSGAQFARDAMGIDWMSRAEMSQAIPPAYTLFIGQQLWDCRHFAGSPLGAEPL